MSASTSLVGTGLLLRSHLARDKWMILWWSLGAAFLYWSQGAGLAGVYATQAELDRAAASLDGNAAFIAMLGPARALDTVGGQIFWQASAMGAVVAGLMSMFLVGRHTRVDEETGRDELVRGAPIGRHAPLVAAFGVALIANLAMGALLIGSLLTLHVDSHLKGMPLSITDSVAAGVGLTTLGWVFSGTALIAAQLTTSARGMYGIAGVVIGASYVLRAVGDVGNGVLTWLSPIGWYQQMYPYSGLRWWPLALLVVAAVGAAAVGNLLFERRDVGAGILVGRPGPARAGAGLRSGLGLAWRLQRGSVYGWTAGVFMTGAAYGAMGDSVKELLGDNQFALDAMAGGGALNLVDAFYATSLVILALIGSGYAISSVQRPRSEEGDGHMEALLATGLSRSAWLVGHVAVTVGGTLVVLAGGGLGLGLGYAATTGDWGAVVRYGVPALMYVPAVLVLSGLARLLYGAAPRRLLIGWLALAFCVVVLMFGDFLKFPGWLVDLSPFHHLPLVPAEDFDAVPVLAVALVATLLSFAGQMAFRRRDIG
ncbi:ABC transporter permease [Nocardioides sp. GY 10113]|uniref:ABC transporter permease n=1 Tax=Nocardioides sp. GY 10113 TaxID=2569761 RepID=UPI0010A8E111|nr:ABC transporter permease [Nocardioides sp. GY 10113]TIC87799.1 ABC transporter permease [Nocardioides sp. GY 10113]